MPRLYRKEMISLDKSIYSLVLSDSVVDAVDALARASGVSRSAMINQILAERVAYTTPEMRLRGILEAVQRSMNEGFFLMEQPTGSSLSCRTSLKYRYKPTVRYSVEIFTHGEKKAGELRVAFRTQNAQLINDLMGFFSCWAGLEQRYIAQRLSQDIVYTIEDGRFTRTLNMPREDISDGELGQAVADYMTMFDGAMKDYFAALPDENAAAQAAENSYSSAVVKQKEII